MVRSHAHPHMQKVATKAEKIAYLYGEKTRVSEKLKELHKNFRGVKHEDSASEMKYTTLRVYEAHLHSIDEELRSLGEEIND